MMSPKQLQIEYVKGVNRKNLDDFYRFMFERHSIWVRRFVQRLKPPWTKDPILRSYKFTNVYRELDHGTIWYKNHVADWWLGSSHYTYADSRLNLCKHDLLWRTIAYRILNRVETFEEIGGVPGWKRFDPARLKKQLYDMRKVGQSIFTSAHHTLPSVGLIKGLNRIDGYVRVLKYLQPRIPSLLTRLLCCESLKAAFEVMQDIPLVGGFIGYEVVTDLTMVGLLPFSEDDWANPGPGCKDGIALIFPEPDSISYEAAITKLRDEQDYHFDRLGLKFPYLKQGKGIKRLTLRAIEHSLCEFQKYWNTREKLADKDHYSRATRRFRPRDWGQLKLFGGKK